MLTSGTGRFSIWIIVPIVVLIIASAFVVTSRMNILGAGSNSSTYSSISQMSSTTQSTFNSEDTASNSTLRTITSNSTLTITNPLPISVSSTPLPRIGLSLHLSLNATVMLSGDHLNITSWEFNTLNSYNELNQSNNWALPSLLDWWPCQSYKHFQIFQGYYTISNITGAIPLPEFPPGFGAECPYVGNTSYLLAPLSDLLVVGGSSEPFTSSWILSGYYPTITQTLTNGSTYITLPFTQGEYTVAYGDEWGDIVTASFMVI
jgi:hypothetical protein